ncbi:DMT family transporter [Nocardiopsis lambiniae]|uniref:DMT family transporter n=1 Tax=Nocardiopsis lambiniae TaxID=3075539 RepID=A0ABU2MJ19_9ACTN|nr:DMT family transporter [Nocardiopsis sp. DSM 44743]MDT0332060.1 DMT family transporter [Nocardiopsis sp. DSM 44743]
MQKTSPLETRTSTLWGLWPALGGMALMGSSVAVIGATADLPAFVVQAARYAVAAIAIIVLARLLGRHLPLPRGRDVLWVVAGALSGLVGFNLVLIVGTAHAEPAVLAAAVACIPIVLSVAGPLTRGRRPSGRVVTGALVVSAGAVAVTGWGQADALGILLALSLIVLEAGFTLFGAPALARMGAWGYTAATTVTAAVIFGVLSLWAGPTAWGVLSDPAALGAVVYLGAIATALSFVLWFTGVNRVGAGAASLAAGVAAPTAALVATALGAPMPSVGTWIGMAVIGVGLVIGFAPAPTEVPSPHRDDHRGR